MKSDDMGCRLPLKGELLKKTVQRYPELEASAMEAITLLKAVNSQIGTRFSVALEEYGLSEGRFYVLCFLLSEEMLEHAAPSPSDIAEQLGVTRATVTGLLDGLERDGFLERAHHSRDRRALVIQMTDKAREVLDKFMPTAARSANHVMAVLDERERTALIGLLRTLESHLEQAS